MPGIYGGYGDRTFAYTIRAVGGFIAVGGLAGVAFFVFRHATGEGFELPNGPVQLGRVYWVMLGLFGLLAACGLAFFFYGLRRLASPGSLAWRLTRFRF